MSIQINIDFRILNDDYAAVLVNGKPIAKLSIKSVSTPNKYFGRADGNYDFQSDEFKANAKKAFLEEDRLVIRAPGDAFKTVIKVDLDGVKTVAEALEIDGAKDALIPIIVRKALYTLQDQIRSRRKPS